MGLANPGSCTIAPEGVLLFISGEGRRVDLLGEVLFMRGKASHQNASCGEYHYIAVDAERIAHQTVPTYYWSALIKSAPFSATAYVEACHVLATCDQGGV